MVVPQQTTREVFVSEQAWIVIGLLVTFVVAPLVALFVAWLRKRLNLSDEAATAIKLTTLGDTKPVDVDQALVLLAEKLAQQDGEIKDLQKRDNAWAMFTWELEHWGLRGWSRAPQPHEPMPQRPARLRPTPEEVPFRPVPEEGDPE